MSEKPSSIDLYRSSKEHITIDPVYCYGVLDNKHFLVMRETQGDNNVYIRWQKNQNTRFSGQNVFGLRAEKLLKLILSKIQNSPMAQETIEQKKIMIEKCYGILDDVDLIYGEDYCDDLKDCIKELCDLVQLLL